MTISEAVSLSIERFLNEDIIPEKKNNDPKKKAIKKKNGQRADYDVEYDKKVNPNISTADNNELSAVADNDKLNISAIAQEVFPDHTPEGAQSQLRKKLKGVKSDSGVPYKLKKKEAKKLRKILSSLLTKI